MKVLLYTEAMNLLGKSGVGKARSHQIRALEEVGVEWTIDPKEPVESDSHQYDFAEVPPPCPQGEKTGNSCGISCAQHSGGF